MDAAQTWWEYRQIIAFKFEEKTGKPYKEADVMVDPEFEAFAKSVGVSTQG